MGVKIGKLFKDRTFQNMSETTKLLYIYLASDPNLNTVGVCSPNLDVMCLELRTNFTTLRDCTKTLVENRYIYVKEVDKVIYFVVPAHFNTVPKSESSIIKVNQELDALPMELREYLESKGISVSAKIKPFIRPTVTEVEEYAVSCGHLIDGNEFIKFYDEQAERYGKKGVWVDSKGKQVRDWKAKMRRIWFKEDTMIPRFANAPEGFEHFYVRGSKGNIVIPDGWVNGKPYSKNFVADLELKKKYSKSNE